MIHITHLNCRKQLREYKMLNCISFSGLVTDLNVYLKWIVTSVQSKLLLRKNIRIQEKTWQHLTHHSNHHNGRLQEVDTVAVHGPVITQWPLQITCGKLRETPGTSSDQPSAGNTLWSCTSCGQLTQFSVCYWKVITTYLVII